MTAAAGGLGTTVSGIAEETASSLNLQIVFGRQKSLLGATQSGPVLIRTLSLAMLAAGC